MKLYYYNVITTTNDNFVIKKILIITIAFYKTKKSLKILCYVNISVNFKLI